MNYRVLFLSHTSRMGGAEKSLLLLLKTLNKEVFKPYLCLPGEGSLFKKAKEMGIETKKIPPSPLFSLGRKNFPFFLPLFPLFLPLVLVKVGEIIKEEKIQLIFTNSIKSHLYGSILGFFFSLPVVWRFHDLFLPELFPPLLRIALTKFANLIPAKILTVSRASEKTLIRGGMRREKVRVIPNGIELLPLPGEKFPLPGGPVIGSVGRISPLKNYECLFLVFPEIKKIYPEAKLLLVGDVLFEGGEYKERLKRISRDLGISQDVVWVGFQEDVNPYLARMDVFVFGGGKDSFPLALLEAMAKEKCVVAPRSGGVPEIIEEGKEGLFFSPQKPEELKKVLLQLLGDKRRREEMGKNARKKVEGKFTLDKLTRKIEKELLEVLK